MIKSKNLLFILFTFMVYSFSTFFSKLASLQNDNIYFVMFYICSLFSLFLYAVCWQYLLKIFPLNIAFPLKSITLIISMFLGYFIFKEIISIKMILSSILIIVGIVLVVK